MNLRAATRQAAAILLFLAIAGTAWLMMHQALRTAATASHHDVVFNPGYQHSERLKVATARAAMDALAMSHPNQAANYQADYRLQRMQIQADSLGLDRWAVHDLRHQGLLLEIHASLAGLLVALDQTSGAATASASPTSIPILPALNRAQSAFSNYSASLTEPTDLQTAHYLFAGPVLLWWLLILILVEALALAWLAGSISDSCTQPRSGDLPL